MEAAVLLSFKTAHFVIMSYQLPKLASGFGVIIFRLAGKVCFMIIVIGLVLEF